MYINHALIKDITLIMDNYVHGLAVHFVQKLFDTHISAPFSHTQCSIGHPPIGHPVLTSGNSTTSSMTSANSVQTDLQHGQHRSLIGLPHSRHVQGFQYASSHGLQTHRQSAPSKLVKSTIHKAWKPSTSKRYSSSVREFLNYCIS